MSSPEGYVPAQLWKPSRLWKASVAAVRDAREARIVGLGAEVAFFWLLALPPTLLAVFGSIGYIADLVGPDATRRIRDQVLDAAGTVLASDAVETLSSSIDAFLVRGRGGVAAVGFVLALWSASRATRAVMQAVWVAYDLEERPSAIRQRLMALGLTGLGVLAMLVILPLVVAGPRLGEWIGGPLGLGDFFAAAWRVLYWPGVGIAGVLLVAGFYHVALSGTTPWRRDLPGALVAAVLWIGGGAGLRLYASLTIEGNPEYGSLGAPIVLLLFLYLTALALLLGAELNAEAEKLWPHGGEVSAEPQ